jgi:hypothetical protein
MFGRQPPFSLGERRCHPASPGAWTGRRDGASMLSSAGQVLWTFAVPPPPPCPPVGTLWPSQNRAQPAGVRQEGSELPQPWGVAKRLTPSPPFRNKCVCVGGGPSGSVWGALSSPPSMAPPPQRTAPQAGSMAGGPLCVGRPRTAGRSLAWALAGVGMDPRWGLSHDLRLGVSSSDQPRRPPPVLRVRGAEFRSLGRRGGRRR